MLLLLAIKIFGMRTLVLKVLNSSEVTSVNNY